MLSRTADSLFWMNRYMERIDGLLRALRIGSIYSFDSNQDTPYSWQPLLTVYASPSLVENSNLQYNAHEVMRQMIDNIEEPNSIKVLLTRARENARGVQDHITKEVWESINGMYHHIQHTDVNKIIDQNEQINLLNDLIQSSLMYYGVTDVTMPRSNGWDYMNLGRYTERCFQTLSILQESFTRFRKLAVTEHNILFWKNMLLSLSGYELYLKTYRTGELGLNIIDLAVFNPHFPRSITYSVDSIHRYILKILEENNPESYDLIEKKIGKLKSSVDYSDAIEIRNADFDAYILKIKTQLIELHQILSQTFFAYY